ncbi:hypothetical protein I302_104044 [Kwoniella bestiolae CBS 10118]|uniref:Uncharacterized protein n=1 Tax=Kwoniella bestiolae CBS 10118 TaxID=1296100 RepID=A0A1B9GA54_9TREE|nr:hypothetical protein I302_02749 [Kwoniella bestiolae CBS 10118]OCF27899.1 hypothetical protein I302_02749 [Kwoniella bestiolae CBS 10118]
MRNINSDGHKAGKRSNKGVSASVSRSQVPQVSLAEDRTRSRDEHISAQNHDSVGYTRLAEHSIESLMEKTLEKVNESVEGPYVILSAGIYDGTGPIDGPNPKWAFALTPENRPRDDAKQYLSTVQSFQGEVSKTGNPNQELKGPLTTASKLIRTLTPQVQTGGPMNVGFSRGRIYTEIGKHFRGFKNPMPWGAIMTGSITEDPLLRRTFGTGVGMHFDALQLNRLIDDYDEDVKERRATNPNGTATTSCENSDQEHKLTFLPDALKSSEADPARAELPTLSLISSTYSPNGSRGRYNYSFHISTSADDRASIGTAFEPFNQREISRDDEERFTRSFTTVLSTLGILMQDGVSDVRGHFTTNENFDVRLEGKTSNFFSRPVVSVTMGDIESESQVEDTQLTF